MIWKQPRRVMPSFRVLTFGAIYLAILITGAILVETVCLPGLVLAQLITRESCFVIFQVVQAVVLLTAAIVISVNLLVDIIYAYLDPRIRYG